MLNKEQTENLITLACATVIFTLGLISAYLYSVGFYDPYLSYLIVGLGIILGTVLAIGMGGMVIIVSIYAINDAREEGN